MPLRQIYELKKNGNTSKFAADLRGFQITSTLANDFLDVYPGVSFPKEGSQNFVK